METIDGSWVCVDPALSILDCSLVLLVSPCSCLPQPFRYRGQPAQRHPSSPPLLTLGLSSFREASLAKSTQHDLQASSQHLSHRASCNITSILHTKPSVHVYHSQLPCCLGRLKIISLFLLSVCVCLCSMCIQILQRLEAGVGSLEVKL